MSALWSNLKAAVRAGEWVTGQHAVLRLRQRKISAWQLASGIDEARLVEARPADAPNPTVVVEQSLADGTPVRVVWAWLASDRAAKLVTVHFHDR